MFASQIYYYIVNLVNSIYNVLLETRSFNVKTSLLYIVFAYFISHPLFYNSYLFIKLISKYTTICITHLLYLLSQNNSIFIKLCFSTTTSGIIYFIDTYQLSQVISIFQMDLHTSEIVKSIIDFKRSMELIHSTRCL